LKCVLASIAKDEYDLNIVDARVLNEIAPEQSEAEKKACADKAKAEADKKVEAEKKAAKDAEDKKVADAKAEAEKAKTAKK